MHDGIVESDLLECSRLAIGDWLFLFVLWCTSIEPFLRQGPYSRQSSGTRGCMQDTSLCRKPTRRFFVS